MKFKPVPVPPDGFETVERARRAVPLVPDSEADCCARLVGCLDLPSRDAARTWLTFLRALELAAKTASGYRRTDREPTVDGCREALLAHVFAADTLSDTLRTAETPLTVDETFAAVRTRVPTWERHRNRSWTEVWRERVAHLLGWLTLLGGAERVDDDPAAYVAR
ncbi:hypothetical protein [Haloplanus sp.]|uniref:hypothetical protein n=1 Tax=Haloplanus sp. TaxID=1961696 RepID=UPI00262BD100|nr:hypothetical protein [Haloplanus sp.]